MGGEVETAVETCAEQRTEQKHFPRRVAVGYREERKDERACDEPELYGGGHVAERVARNAPLALQVGEHGIPCEPERCAGELRDDDDGEDAARPRRHACHDHEWSTTISTPHPSSRMPSGALSLRPHGMFFSKAITAPSTSIHPTLPVPTANMRNMSAQQQPTQKSP